jgi:hypothetical protein
VFATWTWRRKRRRRAKFIRMRLTLRLAQGIELRSCGVAVHHREPCVKEFGCRILFVGSVLLLSLATAEETKNPQSGSALCTECVRIRVGLPRIVRGPALDIADNYFAEIQLPVQGFRGFDAHADTRAIDGLQPWDMGGPARIVLRPGKPGEIDSCGQWLNHAELVGNTVLGFIHNETACRYQANFQTHMSTSLAGSTDYGLSWKSYGQILAGTDSPATSKQTGEGNFTAVNGQDEYYYAYCFRQRDRALIVARAPVSNPYPGNWMKFFKGKWDQPGLGGDATALTGGSGISVARVRTSACALQACQSQTASGRRLPFFVSRRCFYRPRCLSKNWTVTS